MRQCNDGGIAAVFYGADGKQCRKIVPFSSATKYSGVVLAGKAYVVGAPEFVLRQDYAAVQGTIEVFLEKGYRVLVFAEYEGNLDGKELTENATPIAFILLNNAIREGAMDTFRYFSKRGVEVKVISGDNPVTVSEIAKKAESAMRKNRWTQQR